MYLQYKDKELFKLKGVKVFWDFLPNNLLYWTEILYL